MLYNYSNIIIFAKAFYWPNNLIYRVFMSLSG